MAKTEKAAKFTKRQILQSDNLYLMHKNPYNP